jgi:hypothetical protein
LRKQFCRGDPCGLPQVVRKLEIIKTKAGGDKPLPYEKQKRELIIWRKKRKDVR